MQALVQEVVYWPSIDADIANYIKRCAICTCHKASLPAQPMLPQDIPNGPQQEIVVDYFHRSGKDYLFIATCSARTPSFSTSHQKQPSPLYKDSMKL